MKVNKNVADMVRQALCINPFADKIVPAAWNYPPEFTVMTSWQDQVAVLQSGWPLDDTTGLADEAAGYLAQDLWSQKFRRDGYAEEYPLYDGLVVFAKPGSFLVQLGVIDHHDELYVDIANGGDLWGRLCKEFLFPRFTKPGGNSAVPFPVFNNYSGRAMGSDRFLPESAVAAWLHELDEQPGGFACRPFNFGRCLAGYAVETSRWEAENMLSGIATPSWINGQALVTNPFRLIRAGALAIDCGGDRVRFEGDSEFLDAPCLYRDGRGLYFGSRRVEDALGDCGSPFVLR